MYHSFKNALPGFALTALVCLIACPFARATTLNGTPAGLYTPSADVVLDWAAESFTITTPFLLTGAEFVTDEYTPLWDGTLDYGVFASNGSLPGTVLESNSGGRNPVYTTTILAIDPDPYGNSLVQYDFLLAAPLTLSPGTYWIGLHLNTGYGYPDVMGWDGTTTPYAQVEASAPDGNFNSWELGSLQLALGVSGMPISANAPEPASLALAGFGLANVVFRRVRRKRVAAGGSTF
jgi:hypothetical protein